MNRLSRTPIGDVSRASCERCRQRKVRCDRRQPCSRCEKAGVDCQLSGIGEKQRPVPKSYVQALEGQVASLELFLQKLATASNEERDVLLEKFKPQVEQAEGAVTGAMDDIQESNTSNMDSDKAKTGQLLKAPVGIAKQFFGGTSLFQIHLSENTSVPLRQPTTDTPKRFTFAKDDLSAGEFQYLSHDPISQRFMSAFFREQYPYNMCVYREFFLRDYELGSGRYYSEVLLFAICAMGAIADDDPTFRKLAAVFAAQGEALLYPSLECPDLTTLQALLLLGQYEIGTCKPSKGWLFCGMAFRLAHEMGLHLDPTNWKVAEDLAVDKEILRRVYWAAFIADKQISLYFGRPPALHPYESDVRNTIRMPYPPESERLLDTYVWQKGSTTAQEDGIVLVGCFIHQAEMCKIIHSLVTDVFENRRTPSHSTIATTAARQIHVALTKWHSSLPGKLHWNQWTVGQVSPYVLHLHMQFHTAMIILHRPARHQFRLPQIANSESVEICFSSLAAIIRLLRSYSRYYSYTVLPLDFVHTLATAAGVVLMKRFFEDLSWKDPGISKNLGLILTAMEEIEETWPCVSNIRKGVLQAMEAEYEAKTPQSNVMPGIGLMEGLDQALDPSLKVTGAGASIGAHVNANAFTETSNDATTSGSDVVAMSAEDVSFLTNNSGQDGDIGLLITDDLLGCNFTWDHMEAG